MINDDNTIHNGEPFSKCYDVDFQAKKCLRKLELCDEYVLEIYGKITVTEITPALIEKDPQHIGHINLKNTC